MNLQKQFQHLLADRHSPRMAFILLIGLALMISACSGAPSAASSNAPLVPVTGAQATVAPSPMAENTAVPTKTASTGPKAYIGLFKDNAVAVLDTASNQLLTTIPIPTGPHGLVITPDGRWVYVSSDGDSKVSLIDTQMDKVVNTIEVGKGPHGLAMTPDAKWLLVAVFGANQVAFINTQTNTVMGQISVPSPHNIAISPDGATAYVASQPASSPSLAILDIAKQAQSGSITLTKVPRALNFSPDGKQLYFTQAGVDAVQVLDPSTHQVITQIPVGASPHHPLFTSDGLMALVVSQGPGQLSILDPKTNTVSKVVTVGKMPHWIASNAQGTTAWVTNEASNDVSVVDLATATVTATIPIGNAPRKIVVQRQAPPAAFNSAPNAAAATVLMTGMAFSPATLFVKAGQAITWENQDTITHTITSDQGKWDSGNIDPGKSFSVTLSQPGQYEYHCSIHPFMKGTISVTQ
jgi:YVTN family beta-propeller protein